MMLMVAQYLLGFLFQFNVNWSTTVAVIVPLIVAIYFKHSHRLMRPALNCALTSLALRPATKWFGCVLIVVTVVALYDLRNSLRAEGYKGESVPREFSLMVATLSYFITLVGLYGENLLPRWLRQK